MRISGTKGRRLVCMVDTRATDVLQRIQQLVAKQIKLSEAQMFS